MLSKDLPDDKIESFVTDKKYKKEHGVFVVNDSNGLENAREFTKRKIFMLLGSKKSV